jgi:hypothetical protein
MRFTIVTPSFNQLDWLRLCVASVRDQVGTGGGQTAGESDEGRVTSGEDAEKDETEILKAEGLRKKISIEHIVQDAGTEGIEEFAREQGAAFWREGESAAVDGGKVGRWEREKVEDGAYSLTIYSERDAGMYDAINKGLQKARGEISAYLNCDEQYLPGALRWVADYFSVAPNTDVLFGAAIVTRADGSYVCDRRVMVPTRWHTMVSGNLSIFTSSTFFRRTSVVERGLLFDPQWRVCGDAVWALRFLEAGLGMEATHKPLSAFAETGVNMSAVGNPRAAEESRRLALSAPAAARALKPAVLLAYRLRRWWSGAYALKPHKYAVYTAADTRQRRRFDVNEPAFRWQMGAEAR